MPNPNANPNAGPPPGAGPHPAATPPVGPATPSPTDPPPAHSFDRGDAASVAAHLLSLGIEALVSPNPGGGVTIYTLADPSAALASYTAPPAAPRPRQVIQAALDGGDLHGAIVALLAAIRLKGDD